MAVTAESLYRLEPLSVAGRTGQAQNRSTLVRSFLHVSDARQTKSSLWAACILSVCIHILCLGLTRAPHVEQSPDSTRAYGLALHFASVAAIVSEDSTKRRAQVSRNKAAQVPLKTINRPLYRKRGIVETPVKHTLPDRETAGMTPVQPSRMKQVAHRKRFVMPSAERQRDFHVSDLESVNGDPARQVADVTTEQVEPRHGATRQQQSDTGSRVRERIDHAVVSDHPSDSANIPLILEPHYQGRPKPPHYPEQAIRRNQQGTVLVRANVSAQGDVTKAWVFHSSGYRLLDAAALSAVKRWTFMPAVRGGLAIMSRVQVPVDFNLVK